MSDLEAIVPPPSAAPPPYDWEGAESALGTRLPADYKKLIDAYGAGSFEDFLWVLQPGGTNPHLDLVRQAEQRLDALREVTRAGFSLPYDVSSESAEILPWGITDNGDVCYWLTRAGTADEWTVVVNESRGPKWEAYDGNATEYLGAVLSGRFVSEVFPEDFLSESPQFVRLA